MFYAQKVESRKCSDLKIANKKKDEHKTLTINLLKTKQKENPFINTFI